MTRTTTTVQEAAQAGGFVEWLRALLVRLLGANRDSASGGSATAVIGQVEGDLKAGEAFVVAPGGYRIRVPQASDFNHSVGEMMPSVREGISHLPPLPSVVVELLREIQNPLSTAASVAEIASSDPTLAASLIRTVNSAARGMSRSITSVSEAVSHLGFSTVKAIVIRLRLDEVLKPKTEQAAIDAGDLWTHSLAVSYAAECLAQRVDGVDRGFVATLGLLHDIGKLAILAKLPEQWTAVNATDTTDALGGRLEREAAVLGIDHAGIGANLAATWKLPADLVQSIRWHHRPAGAFEASDPPALRKALHVVQIANQLVKYCYPHADHLEIDEVPHEAFTLLGLDSSLPKLLDAPVRRAISRAVLFADGNSRRPTAAPRRFLRPLKATDAIRAAAASTAKDVVRVEVDAAIDAAFAPDALGFRRRAAATPAGIETLIKDAQAYQDKLDLPNDSRSRYSLTIRSFLPNLLPLSQASDTIEVTQSFGSGQLTIAVRCIGLATARRIGGEPAPDAARHLADADFANVLNLGWFARIAITPDGSAVVFQGA